MKLTITLHREYKLLEGQVVIYYHPKDRESILKFLEVKQDNPDILPFKVAKEKTDDNY